MHDLNALPLLTSEDVVKASEVTITGGEPMLEPLELQYVIRRLRYLNGNLRIYLYTAKTGNPAKLITCMEYLDGVTITLHHQGDVGTFKVFQDWLDFRSHWLETKSLRLNYFPESVNIEGLTLDGWKVQALEWQKDCPVPDNEVLLRWSPPNNSDVNYRKIYHELNG
jgi:hypothetical protein